MKRPVDEIADELLVLRVQNGDQRAMQFLVGRWQSRLIRHAWDVTGQRDVAADVVQEAWVAIVRGIGKLKDPAAFRGWAYRIVHHRAVDLIRKQKRRREMIDNVKQQSRNTETETRSDETDEVGYLRNAIGQLNAEEKLLLRMYYQDEMRIREIAQALSIPAGTIKFRLFKLRQHLKTIIKRSQT